MALGPPAGRLYCGGRAHRQPRLQPARPEQVGEQRAAERCRRVAERPQLLLAALPELVLHLSAPHLLHPLLQLRLPHPALAQTAAPEANGQGRSVGGQAAIRRQMERNLYSII